MGTFQAIASQLGRLGEDIGLARAQDRAERLATEQAQTGMELDRRRQSLAEQQFGFSKEQDLWQRGYSTRQQQLYEMQLKQQGWQALPQTVQDPASGKYQIIWYNIHSGERKAIDLPSAPPGTYGYSLDIAKKLKEQFPNLSEESIVRGAFGFDPYVRQSQVDQYLDLIQRRQRGEIPGLKPAATYDEARKWAQQTMAESGASGLGGARLFNPGAWTRGAGGINEANLPLVVQRYLNLDPQYTAAKQMMGIIQQQIGLSQATGVQINYAELQGQIATLQQRMAEAVTRAYKAAGIKQPGITDAAGPGGITDITNIDNVAGLNLPIGSEVTFEGKRYKFNGINPQTKAPRLIGPY